MEQVCLVRYSATDMRWNSSRRSERRTTHTKRNKTDENGTVEQGGPATNRIYVFLASVPREKHHLPGIRGCPPSVFLTQIHRRDDYAAAERAIGAREGDGPGTIWGRGGAGVCLQLPRGDFVTVCECWSGRDSGERTQQEALADRTGASSRGRSVGRMAAGCRRRRQAGSGRARNRARARSNRASQGQRCADLTTSTLVLSLL